MLPNVVEGGIRFWSWRLRVCCKRLGDRSALRWGSGDETQSRLHLMRLAACTVERKIVTELTRFTSSMIPDQDVALVQNVLAFIAAWNRMWNVGFPRGDGWKTQK